MFQVDNDSLRVCPATGSLPQVPVCFPTVKKLVTQCSSATSISHRLVVAHRSVTE
jgi:hypothetical protein